MPVTRFKEIYNGSAAYTSQWYQLDTRGVNNDMYEGGITISNVAAGDTVVVEGTFKDVIGVDKSFLASLTASDIAVIQTVTGATSVTTVVNITQPFAYIRVRKTGTAGSVKIQGVI